MNVPIVYKKSIFKLNVKTTCSHNDYHWEQTEGDPMYPGDNNPRTYMEAICDLCDQVITDQVGDYDSDDYDYSGRGA